MKALIIGLGAAGNRHRSILTTLGYQVFSVSNHTLPSDLNYHSLSEALKVVEPNYVLVCNETSAHLSTLKELNKLNFTGTVLVEKPLDFNSQTFSFAFKRVGVGFNLRFLSSIIELKKILSKNELRIFSAEIYYGNLYTNWRSSVKSFNHYSSFKSKGGGVLRDFSHELDLLIWLFGEPKIGYVAGGKIGEVTIDSDDFWYVSMNTSQVPIINLHLDILDSIPKREIRLLTSAGTILVDILNNKLVSLGVQVKCEGNIQDTYGLMHTALISQKGESVATLEQALKVDELIYKIEAMNHGV
jgi:predicted dehydrogenase